MPSSAFIAFDSFEFYGDPTPPTLRNENPADSATDVAITTSPYFEIIDEAVDVNDETIVISINRGSGTELVYNYTSGWQAGFGSSSVIEDTEDGLKYYKITIDPDLNFDNNTTITIYITAEDDVGNELSTTRSFTTIAVEEEEIPEHTIKYNIYYKSQYSPQWIKSNSEPLNHNLEGNSYTITGLERNSVYRICVVPGILDSEGNFIPLFNQAISDKDTGAGDVSAVNNYPHYIVRTFSP